MPCSETHGDALVLLLLTAATQRCSPSWRFPASMAWDTLSDPSASCLLLADTVLLLLVLTTLTDTADPHFNNTHNILICHCASSGLRT